MHSRSDYLPLPHLLQTVRWQDVRFLCFLTAAGLYGLAGSPTPDNPGWIEGAMGVLLAIAAGSSFTHPKTAWPVTTLFIFGLSVPLATGFAAGFGPELILRDLAGFVFLCLPLFFLPLLRTDPRYERFFLYSLLGIGLCFFGPGCRLLLRPDPTTGRTALPGQFPAGFVYSALLYRPGRAMDRTPDHHTQPYPHPVLYGRTADPPVRHDD